MNVRDTHPCEFCENEYGSKKSLVRHVRGDHPDRLASIPQSMPYLHLSPRTGKGLSLATKLTWQAQNPKQKNSLAHKRYNKYSKSKTLADFYRLNTHARYSVNEDLRSDLDHGYVQLEGAAKRKIVAQRASLAKIKVALLGDSNTTGSGLGKDSYPNRLKAMFRCKENFGGDKIVVSHFGVSGARAVYAANRIHYMSQCKFKAALAWKADIFVVMLGTNDAHQGTGEPEKVEKALEELTNKVKSSVSNAVVLLVLPPGGGKAAAPSDNQSRRRRCTSNMEDKVWPGIRRLATKSGCPAINPMLVNGHLRGDGIHLTKSGASKIARKVRNAVSKIISKKKTLRKYGKYAES